MTKTIALPVLLAAMAALHVTSAQAQPFKHQFGETREYNKHWLGVCPDTHKPDSKSSYERNCWGTTWTFDNAGQDNFERFFPGNRLSVARNRTTGTISITFTGPVRDDIDQARAFNVVLSSGDVLNLTYGSAVTTNGNTINEYLIASPELTTKLYAKMRKANWMTINIPQRGQDKLLSFSMIGLQATMRFAEDYAAGGR